MLQSPRSACAVASRFRHQAGLAALCLGSLIATACGDAPASEGTGTTAASDASGDLGVSDLTERGADLLTAADAVPADAPAAAKDTSPSCPGAAGCKCTNNGECDGALCIDTPAGKRCAAKCVDKCESGFKCAGIQAGADTLTVCVPTWGKLCNPCLTSQACAALGQGAPACIVHGDAGSFCGTECTDDAGCPASFQCKSFKSVEGAAVKQCVPATDAANVPSLCACSAAAVESALATTCMAPAKGAAGSTCPGQRACGADGLTACTAPDVTLEVCDGKDNDCNGKIDDATCGDANACTQDVCGPGPNPPGTAKVIACQHTPLESACDADGSACTEGDVCKAGVCAAGAAKNCDDGNPCTVDACEASTGCVPAPDDGAPCDDDNPCTIGDLCQTNACLPGLPKDCTSTDACQTAKCSQASGKCAFTDKLDGLPCDDDTLCTSADTCDTGACTGTLIVCDDGNPCTTDACDDAKGCSAVTTAGACSDGNACTGGDVCKAGACEPGAAKACDDGDGCTLDTCAAASGECANKAVVGCGGNCAAATDCDDGNPCSTDACTEGLCQVSANAVACDDKEPCTAKDTCKAGSCQGAPLLCDDQNPCTTDACEAGKGCDAVPNSVACSDGSACTVGDQCGGGSCQPGAPLTCDDKNPCTTETCNKADGKCVPTANTAPCSDGSACTSGDVCAASACKPGTAKACDDKNPCTDDKCDPASGACVVANVAGLCSDGNACTGGDACSAGACKPGVAKVCDDKNACTTDSCDPKAGACVVVPIVGCGGNCATAATCDDKNPCTTDACTSGKCANTGNASPCSDGNECTLPDICAGGVCKPGAAKVCDDKNGCTDDSCDAATGTCKAAPNALPCNDGDACTVADLCAAGACKPGKAVDCDDKNPCTTGDGCKLGACVAGVPVVCDDKNPCTNDACDKATGKCVAAPNAAACSDSDACTVGDVCAASACKPGAATNCDDKSACTTDACDKATGVCGHAALDGPCTDNDACTVGDVCAAGACKAGASTVCDDKNPCTTDSCAVATGKCSAVNTTLPCSDGSLCTSGDKCDGAGKCVGTVAMVCKSTACTDNACAPASGVCVAKPKTGGTVCDDGQACTLGDKCDGGGKCLAGVWNAACGCQTDLACNDGNPCTTDKCAATKCSFAVTVDAACDDGDVCSTASACNAAGSCVAKTLVDCSGGKDPCNDAVCAEVLAKPVCKKVPVGKGAACQDGLFCTTLDACDGTGKCLGGLPPLCGKPAQCFQSLCTEAAKGCATPFQPTGFPCTDNSQCTELDACNAGKCIGKPKASCTPKLTAFAPASPSTNAATSADGSGEVGTSVQLYLNGTCTGTPVNATGVAAAPAFNIKMTAAAQACTAVTAQAKDAAGTVSGCSNAITFNHYSCTQCPCTSNDWVRRFGGPKLEVGNHAATDVNGNIYVVGTTEGDLPPLKNKGLTDGFVTKFDPTGKRLWTTPMATVQADSTSAVAVAGFNVWMAGGTSGDLDVAGPAVAPPAGDVDVHLTAADLQSGQLWMVKIFGTATRKESAVDMEYDAVGKRLIVLVTSSNLAGGGVSPIVLSVDPISGTITKLWDYVDDSQNKNPVGIHVDSTGSIFVHGRSQFALPGALNTEGAAGGGLYVIKLSGTGVKQWTTHWGSPGFDYAGGIVSDGAGNVYATGFAQGVAIGTPVGTKYLGSTGSSWGFGGDFIVTTFAAATGKQGWVTQFGTAGSDEASHLEWVAGKGGGLYLAGATTGNIADQSGMSKWGGHDWVLVKLAATGGVLEKRQLGTKGEDGVGRPVRVAGALVVPGWSEADWIGQSPDACTPVGGRDVVVARLCTLTGIIPVQ
ncbi:MAG: hypothetical protein EXR79_15120 [Myxococcales bacterium]|nr:hypothetical protein [Myxococcales bacterium]